MQPPRPPAATARRQEYTTAEASAITDIPVPKINHYIARELSALGVIVWGDGKRRLVGHDGLVALCVADDYPKSLTSSARIEVIRATLAQPRKKDIVLSDDVSVPVSMSRARVAEGLLRLRRATAAIASDPGTLQGEPCFRGTRIPVHTVAGIAGACGIEAARRTYTRLTRPQIELAILYAKAYPRRGRPKRTGEILGRRGPKFSRTVSVSID
jgi:uncharacterized protein (DUF433 family)